MTDVEYLERLRADVERAVAAFAGVSLPVITLDLPTISLPGQRELEELVRKLQAETAAGATRPALEPAPLTSPRPGPPRAPSFAPRDTGRQIARRLPQRRAGARRC